MWGARNSISLPYKKATNMTSKRITLAYLGHGKLLHGLAQRLLADFSPSSRVLRLLVFLSPILYHPFTDLRTFALFSLSLSPVYLWSIHRIEIKDWESIDLSLSESLQHLVPQKIASHVSLRSASVVPLRSLSFSTHCFSSTGSLGMALVLGLLV